MDVWHWLLEVTGVDDPTGRFTNFWGGIGGDIGVFAVLAVFWKRIKCHASGCLRIGLHRVEGTHYVTCRKHHPAHLGSRAATGEQIARAYAEARGDVSGDN